MRDISARDEAYNLPVMLDELQKQIDTHLNRNGTLVNTCVPVDSHVSARKRIRKKGGRSSK